MERYFFNHRTPDGKLHLDIDGILFPSLNAALDEASFAAHAMVDIGEDNTTGCFEIEDSGRCLIARVPYAVTTEAA